MRNSLSLFWDLKGLQNKMARNRHQEGTLEQRNGKWYARPYRMVLLPDGTIKRKRTRELVGPAKKGAKEPDTQTKKAMQTLMIGVNKRESRPIALMPFRDYYEGPFQIHLNATSKNFQASMRSVMKNHILPDLGDYSFTQINRDRIQMLINGKKRQVAPATLRAIKKYITLIYRHARQNDVIDTSSPAEFVKLPPKRQVRPHNALTAGQAGYGIARLPMPINIMSLLGCCCSLGPAELMGGQWSTMNLTNEDLYVRGDRLPTRSVKIAANYTRGELKDPKTEHRERIIPLPDIAIPMLLEWRRQSKFTGAHDFVFASQLSPTGRPILADEVNKSHFKDLSGRLDLKVTWYVFRHTFSTLFETIPGAREFEKKMIAGWSRNRTIGDGYTHTTFERLREIVNGIAALIEVELQKTEVPQKVVMIR